MGTGRVVLVTGVSMDLGRRFARLLTDDPAVDRVIGVDVVPPRGDIGTMQFVRADIRNPVIAKVIAREPVDTVVHMSVIASPGTTGGRTSMKELNVIGTMQLLAAAQQSPTVENLVVKSSAAFYGSSARDPAMFTEDMTPKRQPRSGYSKDVVEVESYVRGFARRRPEVSVTTIRAANVIGPGVVSPITSYFQLPVVPTVLGYDARLQWLHVDDLLAVIRQAAVSPVRGTFNVAGDGVMMLSQALRRLGRPTVKVPSFAMGQVGSLVRQARLADFVPDQVPFLTYGRGLDTTRMRGQLGFEPRYTTPEAFADFAAGIGHGPLSAERVAAVEQTALAAITEVDVPDAEVIPIDGGDERGKRGRTGRRPAPEPGAGDPPAAARRTQDAGDLPAQPPRRIGTDGAPGRGTPGGRPSSASRGLVPGGAPAKRPVRKAATAKGPAGADAAARPADDQDARRPEPRLAAPAEPTAPVEEMPVLEAAPALPEPADAHAARHPNAPTKGIPLVDWLSGFTTASKELFGDDWEPRLAEFLAFLRRRLTGDYVVDEFGFDREVTERFFYTAIRPVAEKWFRVEVRGVENIPAEGGALVVSNHSGTVPVDGLVTAVSLFDHTGRHLRPLGADLVFRLPIISELARKGGTTLACNEDAERMLRGGELVGVWPEGFKGIGKPFADRYKLQRFGRGGFVSAALRTGVPIIPCSVVGAEEIYPIIADVPSLARLLGVPYLPITPLFPLFGPLGMVPLPSKWLIEFGEPIRTDSYDESAADDPMLVFNVTDQVRETIQQTLYSLLDQRSSVFGR